MKTFHYIALALTALLLVTSCAIDEMWSDVEPADEQKVLTFKPKFEDFETVTKAIGDGSKVDKLLVQVYEENGETPVFSKEYSRGDWSKVQIAFYYGKTYKVYFWAYHSNAQFTAYEYKKEDGNILLNKPIKINYPETGLAYNTLESLDAFYSVQTVNLSDNTKKENTVQLTRPFAQVNLGALAQDFTDADVSKVEFTVNDIPSNFTLSDSGVGAVENNETVISPTFTFTEFLLDEYENKIVFENEYYRYIGTTYIIVPTWKEKVSVDVAIYGQDANNPIKEATVDLTLATNNRTNLIFKQIAPSWNDSLVDSKEDVPSEPTDGWIHITKPEELAALMIFGAKDSKYRICNNLDLAGMSDDAKERLEKAILDGTAVFTKVTIDASKGSEEGSYTIYNIKGVKALFATASSITIQNLVVDGAIVSGNTHVGVLVNSLSGLNTFTNVTIQNSSATTASGAAGGMIGYAGRSSEKDRSETLSVIIDNCKINSTTVAGKQAGGKFVGLFSGYDNDETLVFTGCSADDNTKVADYDSRYVEGNEGAWLAEKDYTAYNGWLGDEEYYRGKIYFGDPKEEANRFCLKWDGKTTVEPLLADPKYDGTNDEAETNKFAVYSPFDLAGVRKKTDRPAAIYLMNNVDMFGQGKDGKYNVPSEFTESKYNSIDDNKFSTFSSVSTLEGFDHTIYNLKIEHLAQGSTTAAFIGGASGTTFHQNTKFDGCCVVSTHANVNTDAKAYGAIVCCNPGGTYTMTNIHVKNCKLFALQKVGIMCSRVSGTSNFENCSVDNCYIENYKCEIEEDFAKLLTDKGLYCQKCVFYPYGEIGGFIGFLQANSAITSCSVTSTTINCYGQKDKSTRIGLNKYLAISYSVPGRHVNQFIGDIRTDTAQSIVINGCTVINNTYDQDSWNHSYSSTQTDIVGCAYAIPVMDDAGTLRINGSTIKIKGTL